MDGIGGEAGLLPHQLDRRRPPVLGHRRLPRPLHRRLPQLLRRQVARKLARQGNPLLQHLPAVQRAGRPGADQGLADRGAAGGRLLH